MPPSPERARWAIALIFFVHGLFWGSWAPHIPLAKERLSTDTGVFGMALLCMALGAMIAMPIAGHLVHRFGSARLTLVTGLCGCIALPFPAIAPALPLFVIALFVFGASLGSMDVAMNAHGLIVERQLKRAVMSGFHGLFSLAGLVGGSAAWLVLDHLPEIWHLLGANLSCLILLLTASRWLLPNEADKDSSVNAFAMPTRATLGLGVLCFLALMAEGSLIDWSGIHLRETLGTSPAFAALAFAFFSGGMAISRFIGDWLRTKLGAVHLVRWSAVAAVLAIVIALSVDDPPIVIMGLTAAGLGLGNIAPVLFAGGGRVEPLAPGRGIAAVTTLGYTGFLVGPPLIGFTAELTGLRLALGLTAVAALIVATAASAVRSADTY
jgi:MFS family permease